jgi:hypothetical protein
MGFLEYKKIDVLFMSLLVITSALLFIYVRTSSFTYLPTLDAVGAGFFPTVSSLMIMIAGGLYLLTRRVRKNGINQEEEASYLNISWHAITLSIMALVFIYLVTIIGLIVTTFLCLNLFIFILGFRKIRTMLLVSFLITLLIWFLFVQVIGLYFPNALLF